MSQAPSRAAGHHCAAERDSSGGRTTYPLTMSKIGLAATLFLVTLLIGALFWVNRPTEPLASDTRIDLLVLDKSSHRLSAYAHGALVRSYPVSLGRDPVGPKVREGDRKTPEGRYFIDRHNPSSAFHLALHVSYPSPADVARAQSGGYSAGGDIMIHGIRNGLGWLGRAHRLVDWTVGCIAVTDP